MTNLELGSEFKWSLAPLLSIEHPFFYLNAETIIYTWIMMTLLVALVIGARIAITKHYPLVKFFVLASVESLMNLTSQALGTFQFSHFAFISALFIFIFFSNILSAIPWLDEPTKDLNTPLALGIISFFYAQYAGISKNGLLHYLKEYFAPFFLMFPIHVIGKLASIISISFRLFGNIFGGSIITSMLTAAIKGNLLFESICLLTGLNLIMTGFFTLFEGFLQAFVFAMLSLTYLSMTLQAE
jgi:F-type H+-transporting ATPase subunit a